MKEQGNKITRRDFLKYMGGVGVAISLGSWTENVEAMPMKGVGDDGLKQGSKPELNNEFKDSLGRTIQIPKNINKIIPTGQYAESLIMTLCPEKLVSIVDPIERTDYKSYQTAGMKELCSLPTTGEMYPSKSKKNKRNLNVQKISEMDADIILDVGTKKKDVKINLEYVQNNSGIPTIFIDGSFGQLPQAYRTLGMIANCSSRAEELANFVENAFAEITERRGNVKQHFNVYYAKNDGGMYANGSHSFQNEAIKFLKGRPIIVKAKNGSLQIDLEDLYQYKIDYILFNDSDCFINVMNSKDAYAKKWKAVEPIEYSRYMLSPGLFHNWMGFPLFVQVIGMLWLGAVLWPDIYDYSLEDKIREFYRLFYSYEVGDDEIIYLLFGALEKIERTIVIEETNKIEKAV